MLMMEQSSSSCSSTSHCQTTQHNKCAKDRGQASSSSSGALIHVEFPEVPVALLDCLNQQRLEGKLCDLSIHVQGQVFRAHKCVLAASSPYFHDQVLLKNVSSVVLPSVMDPFAFESVLGSAYTGKLTMLTDEIVNYLTVGSVLQMWHVVDKCSELLRESRTVGSGANSQSSHSSSTGSVDSSGNSHTSNRLGHCSSRASENQSPSSTNYFSPREAGSSGSTNAGNGVTTGGCMSDGTAASGGTATVSLDRDSGRYARPGEENFLDEEEIIYQPVSSRKKSGRIMRRRKMEVEGQREREETDLSLGDENDMEDTVSDSGSCSFNASTGLKRPAYIQPSIMPRKQWVLVKKERPPLEDLLLTCEDDEDPVEIRNGAGSGPAFNFEAERERTLSISNVRTLSGIDIQDPPKPTSGMQHRTTMMDEQVNFCESSEDYIQFESGTGMTGGTASGSNSMEDLSHHLGGVGETNSETGSGRSTGPGIQLNSQRSLLPIDMQGNQIVVYHHAQLAVSSAVAGLQLVGASSSATSSSSGGSSGVQSVNSEHGAVQISPHASDSGKIFMCHCGKTFTHRSMRDRHVNMHLNLRPFDCPVCSKKFKMKHHLTEHMKTHTGLKPYNCDLCGKKFMWRDSFMRHKAHCERRNSLGVGVTLGTAAGPGGTVLVVSPHSSSGSNVT
ncbi:ZBT22 protein, partial [Polypterus senegalus]|nr:zinc finger and BTB domain-containing protein 22-like isoform X2 [Polypterus senegalus]XP_039624873.1 zinc finger and BTB domain-containing protein 22-like isoform X2 [Polypterus senegalus]MBN3290602.1 ZBT22 protein [Polypterus senegalus]